MILGIFFFFSFHASKENIYALAFHLSLCAAIPIILDMWTVHQRLRSALHPVSLLSLQCLY